MTKSSVDQDFWPGAASEIEGVVPAPDAGVAPESDAGVAPESDAGLLGADASVSLGADAAGAGAEPSDEVPTEKPMGKLNGGCGCAAGGARPTDPAGGRCVLFVALWLILRRREA